ncbi:MAG: transcriptional regulator [Firmicutes bacterium]|nr:transcriptional regulator [Bacillota bacterium]
MLTAAKKVVIITEATIEEKVIQLLNTLEVKGYTVHRSLTGKGERGIRSGLGGLINFGENICIEIIVSDEHKALAIMEAVYNKFLAKNYAGIAYLEDIRVIRPEKF